MESKDLAMKRRVWRSRRQVQRRGVREILNFLLERAGFILQTCRRRLARGNGQIGEQPRAISSEFVLGFDELFQSNLALCFLRIELDVGYRISSPEHFDFVEKDETAT